MGDYLMSLIKANNITNTTGGIPTVKGQKLIPTAWVNFAGEGTVAIRDSENVSSITDNGSGQYTVSFAVAMANVNYSACGGGGGTIRNNTVTNVAFPQALYATGSLGVDTQYAHSTAFDPPIVNVAILGGQS